VLWRLRGDALEHQELGAVEMTDHRNVRKAPRSRLVEGSQVVQVKNVGGVCAGGGELALPGGDDVLVGVVVYRGEDAVRRSRSVLVRRVKRGVAGEWVGRVARGGVVDRVHVEP